MQYIIHIKAYMACFTKVDINYVAKIAIHHKNLV